MATITLYKEKVNGVGGLIDNLIKSSSNLDVQLGTLKNTLQGVDSSTCNLQDTVDSISSSSKSEKSKIEDLKKLNNKLSEFIETASRKDSAAEEEIKKSKEDFYTKYSYLKPECEKSVIEHICDGVQSAAEWCKEHWKLIVTIAIVIVSVAVLLIPGVGPIIAGACWGAILGACIGGVSGGLESVANGGSFLEGFEDGALSGAISGAIGGAAFAGLGQLGAVAGKGIKCMSGFGKFIKGTASVTKVMSTAMGGFDTIALVDKAFGNGDIATLNAKLHESKAYNIFQTGVTATAVFTGGMTTTMKCFVAGTLVLTASGLVAIENIKPGDMVYAADAETLEVSTKQVLETYIRETSSLVHLTINGENIISTYDHPYYVKDKGFVSAGALWIGAELIDKDGNVVENGFHNYDVVDNLKSAGFLQLPLKQGYDLSKECRFCSSIDLRGKTSDEIFNAFSSATRRNTRTAQKYNVHIRKLNVDQLHILDSMEKETSARQDFEAMSLDYFKNLYRFYGEDHVETLLSYLDLDEYEQKNKKE